MSNYYIAKPGTQQPMGPMTIDEIRVGIQQGTITPDCVYCAVGMQQWLPLAQLPGLNTPKPVARPVPGGARPMPGGARPMPGAAPTPGGLKVATGTAPSSGLASSILVTIFCCVPFGIPAIVHSARCNTFINQGDYAAARQAADKAATWRMWAIIGGVIPLVLNVLVALADM